MDAIIYTMDGQEYEMLSGILEEESPGLAVSRGVIDGEYHLFYSYILSDKPGIPQVSSAIRQYPLPLSS